jgi:hypothetical protein
VPQTWTGSLKKGMIFGSWNADNIKMDLMEIGINGVNWFWLAQDRVQWWAFMSTVMNLWVP